MAIDVNALIRRAKTLSNGVHGAVNVGQGLRNVPADKHYSAGQMKAFAAQCTRIADAVMELPDNGSGNRAEANRVFASAGGAFYDLAGNITGSAHQFSFEIANSPDKLIVIGIKVLERMASGKSAKAAAVIAAAKAVGVKQDDGEDSEIVADLPAITQRILKIRKKQVVPKIAIQQMRSDAAYLQQASQMVSNEKAAREMESAARLLTNGANFLSARKETETMNVLTMAQVGVAKARSFLMGKQDWKPW